MSEPIVVHIDPDLADLIPGFLENRQQDIVAIEECMAQDNLDKVRVIGHSMKGVGGGYGFDAISEFGAAIERAAQNSDLESIQQAVAKLDDYLRRVQVVYDNG